MYHNFRQLWLVLGVKLMEINSNLFSNHLFSGVSFREGKPPGCAIYFDPGLINEGLQNVYLCGIQTCKIGAFRLGPPNILDISLYMTYIFKRLNRMVASWSSTTLHFQGSANSYTIPNEVFRKCAKNSLDFCSPWRPHLTFGILRAPSNSLKLSSPEWSLSISKKILGWSDWFCLFWDIFLRQIPSGIFFWRGIF